MTTRTTQVIPYLTFGGDCEEALNFYRDILGGEVTIVNRYDNPAMNAPEDYKNKVLHARLLLEGAAIYASDTFPGQPVQKTSGDISLSVILNDLDKATEVFARLSEGGHTHFPFGKQFWGNYHGALTDRYGFKWNINYEEARER